MKRTLPFLISVTFFIFNSLEVISQNSIELNGVTDYVAVQHNESLSIAGNFTIEAWIKPFDISGEKTILIKGNNGQCGNYGLFIKDGNLAYVSAGECGWNGRGPNSSLAVGVWQHVAAVGDGNNLSLFIDGELKDTIILNSVVGPPNGDELWIGRSVFSTSNFFFNGLIDEVRIWSLSKSQIEIQSSFNTELSGLESDLLLYYKLDDINEECDVSDCSINENHGTRININNNTSLPQLINDQPSNLTNVECGVEFSNCIPPPIFEVEKIHDSGDPENRINFVILSDGYQQNELPKFVTDAENFIDLFFNTTPYKEYANYFNFYIIKVPSNESGASHPGTATDIIEDLEYHPISTVDNYFGSTFDIAGIHRLLVPINYSKISSVLAENFPLYDQALILVNSPYYGGSGGEFATASTDQLSAEVMIHEVGHSFAQLADEYWTGFCFEQPNVTQETNPSLVKWKNWLNINGIGIYEIPLFIDNAPSPTNCYKPAETCMMSDLSSFCSVCAETTIEKIHSIISPIVSYTPSNDTINEPIFPIEFVPSLIAPSPNSLNTSWQLNQSEITINNESLSLVGGDLLNGFNELTLTVQDTTQLLRIDDHQVIHQYSVTWTINNTDNGADDDNDGITNSYDTCPNTPEGEAVDALGCSASQRDSDNDGFNDDVDLCPDTPEGETVDSNGCSDSQKDTDGDGVTDDIDQCPNTSSSQATDQIGCELFPFNAFTIYTETPACPGFNDGLIEISVSSDTEGYVFDVQLTGNGRNETFTDALSLSSSVSIADLAPGTYTVSISLDEGYNIVYDAVVIGEPTDLSAGKTRVDDIGKMAYYNVSGNRSYSVTVNSKRFYYNLESKEESTIAIPVDTGNNAITIKGAECQSVFSDLLILDGISWYPNPVTIGFYLNGRYKGKAYIFNASGSRVKALTLKGDYEHFINIQDLPLGVYFVKFADNQFEPIKIIKQ